MKKRCLAKRPPGNPVVKLLLWKEQIIGNLSLVILYLLVLGWLSFSRALDGSLRYNTRILLRGLGLLEAQLGSGGPVGDDSGNMDSLTVSNASRMIKARYKGLLSIIIRLYVLLFCPLCVAVWRWRRQSEPKQLFQFLK